MQKKRLFLTRPQKQLSSLIKCTAIALMMLLQIAYVKGEAPSGSLRGGAYAQQEITQ